MIRTDPLVKRLKHAYPWYELRINEWRYRRRSDHWGYGFRLIFFTHFQGDTQHIFFVNGMIKREKSPIEFEKLIVEALNVYQEFVRDRWKYLRRD
jgi:hypothetical protein